MEKLTSRKNPVIQHLRRLGSDNGYRTQQGEYVLDGVKLLREAGATEVHVRLSSPPFRHPCYFGTDIDSTENLIAAHHTEAEIAELIGADSVGYLSLEDCDKLARGSKCAFCKGCFSGVYPVDPPQHAQKNKFERPLSEKEQ